MCQVIGSQNMYINFGKGRSRGTLSKVGGTQRLEEINKNNSLPQMTYKKRSKCNFCNPKTSLCYCSMQLENAGNSCFETLKPF